MEYLLSIGRRKIGLLAGPLDWLESRQRKQGWEDALNSYGIESSPRKWVQGNWSSASGEIAFAELYKNFREMDAVFASNDQMALGAMHYSHSQGIRIPEDIAFIGFDDLPEGAFFTPSLSTVTHPLRDLGKQSVKALLEQIQGKNLTSMNRTIILDTGLIIRESTQKL